MKKRYFLLFTVYCLLLTLWGCGTGPGAPGSTGCEDFGLICEVASITPTYLGADTSDVDAYDGTCGTTTPYTPEPWGDHTATIVINVSLMNPTASVTPPPLFIENYSIQYVALNDSIGAPPIQSYSNSLTLEITPPPTGTPVSTVTQTGLIFVDIPRKNQYWNDMQSGVFSSAMNNPNYINNYSAIYTIQGQIQGTTVTMIGTAGFSIGNYNYCGTGIPEH